VIQSSPIRKYCYVPGGKKIQSSLDTTVVSGTLRSAAISQLNRIASSPEVLIHEWLRFTRTKITLCRIALLNRQDHLHEPAEQLYKKRMKSGFCFLTTSAVLDETANALCDPAFKPSVITFFHIIKNSPRVEIVFVDPGLWSKGWALCEQRPDKAWSLTGCISFEVIREQKIHDALTSERHFVQAGYQALLMEEE